jgi:hypothetical protein
MGDVWFVFGSREPTIESFALLRLHPRRAMNVGRPETSLAGDHINNRALGSLGPHRTRPAPDLGTNFGTKFS